MVIAPSLGYGDATPMSTYRVSCFRRTRTTVECLQRSSINISHLNVEDEAALVQWSPYGRMAPTLEVPHFCTLRWLTLHLDATFRPTDVDLFLTPMLVRSSALLERLNLTSEALSTVGSEDFRHSFPRLFSLCLRMLHASGLDFVRFLYRNKSLNVLNFSELEISSQDCLMMPYFLRHNRHYKSVSIKKMQSQDGAGVSVLSFPTWSQVIPYTISTVRPSCADLEAYVCGNGQRQSAWNPHWQGPPDFR